MEQEEDEEREKVKEKEERLKQVHAWWRRWRWREGVYVCMI